MAVVAVEDVMIFAGSGWLIVKGVVCQAGRCSASCNGDCAGRNG
jgi:hypothetical protein